MREEAGTVAPLVGRLGVAVAVAAAIAFSAFVVLLGFADDWRTGRDGGAHALSNSAVGFEGIARLLAATREGPASRVVRDNAGVANAQMLVLTPGAFTGEEALASTIGLRKGPTLIVLEKWQVMPYPGKPGWVRAIGPVPRWEVPLDEEEGARADDTDAGDAEGLGEARAEDGPTLAERLDVKTNLRDAAKGGERLRWTDRGFSIAAPAKIQTIEGEHIAPLLVARGGGIVLGQVRGEEAVFILADPDLINNQALKSLAGAEAAVELFDQLPGGTTAQFDVTMNGYARSPNLIKLMFEPPFLAATLSILAAACLALGHAAVRFGPARAPERRFAFGKRTLIDNAAALVQQAGREAAFAARYAGLMRDAAAERGAAADERFAALHAKAAEATDGEAALAAAKGLYQWKEEVLRDRR